MQTRALLCTIVRLSAVLAVAACDKSSTTTTPPTTPPPSDTVAAGSDDTPEGDEGADVPAPEDDPGAADEPAEPSEPTDDGATAYEPGGPVPVRTDPAEGITEPTEMASIKLEIKSEEGKVHRDSPKIVRWEELTRIPIDFGDRLHEFDVELTEGDKSKVEIEMSYQVGGKEVLRKYRFDTKVGQREVVRIEGGVAVAITVMPKTIEPRPAAQREVMETPATKDPLAGVEKGSKAK